MSRRPILMFALALSAVPLLAGFSDSPKFNVMTGLWETIVVTKTSGTLPIPDDALARMSPEQRQNLEAAIKAQEVRGAQPHTTRTCLTQEKIDRGFQLDSSKRPNCRRTIVTNTANAMEIHEECTENNGTTAMKIHYEAVDPQTVKGTFHMEITRQGKTMDSDGSIQGKWIAESCGDIK